MWPPCRHGITKCENLRLNRDIGNECQYLSRVSVRCTHGCGLGEGVLHDIAGRHITSVGRELTNQLTTHAGAAASDDGNSAGESIFKTFAHESLHF